MPFNGSGTFTLVTGNPVITGTVISSTVHNNTQNDIAAGLTNTVTRDGQSAPMANLPMGGFKHTGAAQAVASGQYIVYEQAFGASGFVSKPDLADLTDIAKGAAMVGYQPSLSYAAGLGAFLNYTFGRTAGEIAAAVTPSNYAYPPGNVFRYGAVCNGVADDGPAFNRAIAATPSTGGTVTVPALAGYYQIATTILVNKDVTISGGSMFGSRLRQGAAVDTINIASPCTIRGLRLEGVKATYGSGCGVKQLAGGWAYVHLEDMSAYFYPEDGFQTLQLNAWVIQNCTANDNARDGFYIDGACATLINCAAENNGRDGFSFTGTTHAVPSFYSYNNLRNQVRIAGAHHTLSSPSIGQTVGNTNPMILLSGTDNEVSNPFVFSMGGATYVLDMPSGANNNVVKGFTTYSVRVQSGALDNVTLRCSNVTDATGNRTVQVGPGIKLNNGALISNYLSTTQSISTFGLIPDGAISEIGVALNGAVVGDTAIATPNGSLAGGLIWNARVSSPGVVAVRITNCSGGALTPATFTWRVSVIN